LYQLYKVEEMKRLNARLLVAVLAVSIMTVAATSLAAPGKSNGNGGWESSADHLESVVISLNSDPVIDPEPACIALQIGINLLSDTIAPPSPGVPVIPVDEVILFPTVGGVDIVNPEYGVPDSSEGLLNSPECTAFTPAGVQIKVALNQLLTRFTDLGGQTVVCPICKLERFPNDDPNFGIVGNGVDIHNLFLYADKVISF
jgi:hypothetical protein